MKITQINLSGLNLISADYSFVIRNVFDVEKDIITNDLFGDGQAFGRSKNKPKTLALNGIIRTFDVTKITALNQIIALNGLKPLIITVDVIGQLMGYIEITSRAAGSNSRMISIQLTMPNPYLYALTPQTVALGATSNASLVLPVTLPFTLGGLTGGTGTLTNQGNAVAYPIVTIIGTCDTISITNTTTGASMSCAVSLLDTDTLIIDSTPTNRGIYLNGVQRMDLKNGQWLSCPPGDNNFSFGRNSLQVKQHCQISLQSRYI